MAVLFFRKARAAKAKPSAIAKIADLITALNWARVDFEIEEMVTFFNTVDEHLKAFTEVEWLACHELMTAFRDSTKRYKAGWFRADAGKPATQQNVFIKPFIDKKQIKKTGDLPYLSIEAILANVDPPSNHKSHSATNVTVQEFYTRSARQYAKSKVELLDQIHCLMTA